MYIDKPSDVFDRAEIFCNKIHKNKIMPVAPIAQHGNSSMLKKSFLTDSKIIFKKRGFRLSYDEVNSHTQPATTTAVKLQEREKLRNLYIMLNINLK